MTTIELTDDQRQALQIEHGKPLDVVDPATQQRYVLLAQEQYERVRSLLEQPRAAAPERIPRIGSDMLRSMQAYWRELPELLKVKSKKQQWVAYHGDVRIAFGRTDVDVYQACFRNGLARGDFYVGKIESDETPPWGTLEGDWSLYEVSEPGEAADPPVIA